MRALLILAALAFAIPDRRDPSPMRQKPLPEDILGEWQVVQHRTGGRDDNRNNLMWVFTKATMQHVNLVNGTKRPASIFPYTLDVTKNPAVIVFPAAKFAGILKVEGDLMTICLHATPTNTPPPEFASPPNTLITLLQLTRVKK